MVTEAITRKVSKMKKLFSFPAFFIELRTSLQRTTCMPLSHFFNIFLLNTTLGTHVVTLPWLKDPKVFTKSGEW